MEVTLTIPDDLIARIKLATGKRRALDAIKESIKRVANSANAEKPLYDDEDDGYQPATAEQAQAANAKFYQAGVRLEMPEAFKNLGMKPQDWVS